MEEKQRIVIQNAVKDAFYFTASQVIFLQILMGLQCFRFLHTFLHSDLYSDLYPI